MPKAMGMFSAFHGVYELFHQLFTNGYTKIQLCFLGLLLIIEQQ